MPELSIPELSIPELSPPELWLVFASFFTSSLTAVFGVGGGLMLISLMPGAIPATAIIPVHGMVQLSSNASRALFGRQFIRWDYLSRFLPGAIVGSVLASQFVLSINMDYIPLILGLFILTIVWAPIPPLQKLPARFFSFGIIHSLMSTLGGAAGPLLAAFLSRESFKRDTLVATFAAFMSTSHLLKVSAFTALGFDFMKWLPLMLLMSISVVLGSWFGTRIRPHIPEINFKVIFRWIVTLLACRMVALTLFEIF
ncbi:hypothetical protein GZ77_23325 [Endozoicomonas montiporae]|uniref:Probable membrane transporter protein n=2 Tax=Endozoicomonas montiporae TaxID=1027273 RepID=A0A081N0Q0_9GAMM|nr:sulfite exporter TauE/SafE family protein [Endozoicomonas montiporae]AMO54497.1 hypothetical protein EZMO1_0232 [Endozoicomonas montiporae CL-33]KEQ12023.1 hypothetical protein GZ77_23325 [Endozoicomonas montiporae]